MAAAETGPALAPDRVDLVDEDDRGCLLAGGLEHVADTRRADADEHLHEVRARDRHERHSRLACDGARDECLAAAGRAHEQHPLGDARSDLPELAGRLQELDDLLDLLFHAFVAGDVAEGGLRLLGGVHLRHHELLACGRTGIEQASRVERE